MALTRPASEFAGPHRIEVPATIGRKAVAMAAGLVVIGFVVTAESLAPLPLVLIACALVAGGFAAGIYAWMTGATVDEPHTTAWDWSGLMLFAGFALATAIGSSWMTV